MEFCRRWGIAQEVRNCGFPSDYPLNQVFCTSLNGHHIGTIAYPSIDDESFSDFSPEKKQRCPQLWFDPILSRAVAREACVDIRYGTRLVEYSQDEEGVTAVLQDVASEVTSHLRANYLIACDGAGSGVRRSLDIPLLGDAALSYSVGIYFTAHGLLAQHRMGPAERYMLIGEEGTWGHLTVVDAKDIWRLTIIGTREKIESENFDPNYWLRRCFGSANVSYQVDAVLPWKRSRLVAERYSHGRIFLAGDACHVMAPNGGYGMNTGLGDAMALAWKLEAVLHGWGHPALLDTYQIERQPVAWRNVDAAARNFSTMAPQLTFQDVEADGAQGARVRAKLKETMVDATRQEWEPHGINMGYHYGDSPVIISDGSPAPPDDMSAYEPTGRPGHRAPHFTLPDGRSTLDLFGRGFVLLEINAEGSPPFAPGHHERVPAAGELGIPFQSWVINDARALSLYGRRYALVRPDGHVAWRADDLPADFSRILKRCCGWQLKREQGDQGKHPRQTGFIRVPQPK